MMKEKNHSEISIFTDKILQILYAPLHYVHHSYLNEFKHNKEFCDELINFWIIQRHRLSDLPEDFIFHDRDDVALLFVNNWLLIPTIALLIGSFLNKKYLRKDFRIVGTLGIRCQLFTSLPLQCQVKYIETYHHDDVVAMGIAFLLGLGDNIPLAFRQRFFLLFSENIILPELNVLKTPDNFNLLKMATMYAKNKFC
ncbi:hypothetical protein QCA75_004778 [Salmonella enterica]|nr:hypothetical protein [Salmonella enterica]